MVRGVGGVQAPRRLGCDGSNSDPCLANKIGTLAEELTGYVSRSFSRSLSASVPLAWNANASRIPATTSASKPNERLAASSENGDWVR